MARAWPSRKGGLMKGSLTGCSILIVEDEPLIVMDTTQALETYRISGDSPMNSASLAGCSILICEDEPLIALGIADAFTNAGARVLTVTSLARALIAIEAEFRRP